MSRLLVLLLLTGLTAACARTDFQNAPLASYDASSGYRLALNQPESDEDVALIVSFSGGGMRATAFAMGALEALQATTYSRKGEQRNLLDEVDLISSVSGGSVTAAAYGLYGPESFGLLERSFLYDDIMGELIGTGLNPVTWVRLASPDYSRIDALVELFDERFGHGASFAAMQAGGQRPYVMLNAADMSSGDVFSFTQEDFDLICSDLSRFPVARAAAASAAFPIALTPVTLQNHSGPDCKAALPAARTRWTRNALRGAAFNLDGARRADRTLSLLRRPEADRDPQYIHLLDGGLADNLGLQGPYRLLNNLDLPGNWLQLLNEGAVDRVAIIVVNARSDADRAIDAEGDTPGVVSQFGAVTSVPIDGVSAGKQQGIRENLDGLRAQAGSFKRCLEILGDKCAELLGDLKFKDTPFYIVDLDFDLIGRLDPAAAESEQDRALRRTLKNIPTTWTLTREQVDLLRKTAGELLRAAPDFKALMTDLDQPGS